MPDERYLSWGRIPRALPRDVIPVRFRDAPPDLPGLPGPLLPFGCGRSYGDSCLNEGGTILDLAPLDRFISFDAGTGVLRCEAGVTFDEILRLTVPKGWFPAAMPGTKYITVGGAIANDVHGKNHHRSGTFGCHVRAFELLRSDGSRTICTPTTNRELFRATIGGLGLTGMILWAEFQLKDAAGPFVTEERLRLRCLDNFFALSDDSDDTHEFTVAWIDALARGRRLGRGVFFRANHATVPGSVADAMPRPPRLGVPMDGPGWLLNAATIAVFNHLFYHGRSWRRGSHVSHFDRFFHPLDGIRAWNRLYGRRGFLQWQCVLPPALARDALHEILERTARSGSASFLSVLKRFGSRRSPGMLSFPRPGITLALDFAMRGGATMVLLEQLDACVREAGGAIYPAKDGRMSPATFRAGFPDWEDFAAHIDPRFSSSFWRRVTGNTTRSSR